MTVALALIASLFIGVSDFTGGLASRTRDALEVAVIFHWIALIGLIPVAAAIGADALTAGDLGLGALSGVATGIAYIGFFSAIGHGRISIVVPISAAVTALFPVAVGLAGGDALSGAGAAGVLCALVAIPLVAYSTEEGEEGGRDVWPVGRQVGVSLLCGIGYGAFFICIGHTSEASGLWPTVGNLLAGSTVTGLIAAARGSLPRPASVPGLAIVSGLTIVASDTFLTIALQKGPLAVATVLGNLYPIVTIALGVAVLGERIRSWHLVGIAFAIAGVALIALG